jgi:hypothetical protein
MASVLGTIRALNQIDLRGTRTSKNRIDESVVLRGLLTLAKNRTFSVDSASKLRAASD